MSGRGGRGQALLAALSQPVRKPGLQSGGTDESAGKPLEPQVLQCIAIHSFRLTEFV